MYLNNKIFLKKTDLLNGFRKKKRPNKTKKIFVLFKKVVVMKEYCLEMFDFKTRILGGEIQPARQSDKEWTPLINLLTQETHEQESILIQLALNSSDNSHPFEREAKRFVKKNANEDTLFTTRSLTAHRLIERITQKKINNLPIICVPLTDTSFLYKYNGKMFPGHSGFMFCVKFIANTCVADESELILLGCSDDESGMTFTLPEISDKSPLGRKAN